MSDGDYRPLDRRPVASRERKVFQRLAAFLAARGVSPNTISVAGMLCGMGAGVAFGLAGRSGDARWLLWLAGAALVQARLVANLLDGMVAIVSGRASPVGELYNEVPDRVSDTAVLVGLGYAEGGNVILGVFAALAAMFTAYVRTTGKAAGALMDFGGPMAKQHRMFVVTLTAVFMAVSPVGWRSLPLAGRDIGIPAAALALVLAGGLWTAVRRLRRAAASLRVRS
ncbi:MAG: CDP-alcohol phosphatidyltransferase family protein [Planctomycetota bacterium]